MQADTHKHTYVCVYIHTCTHINTGTCMYVFHYFYFGKLYKVRLLNRLFTPKMHIYTDTYRDTIPGYFPNQTFPRGTFPRLGYLPDFSNNIQKSFAVIHSAFLISPLPPPPPPTPPPPTTSRINVTFVRGSFTRIENAIRISTFLKLFAICLI